MFFDNFGRRPVSSINSVQESIIVITTNDSCHSEENKMWLEKNMMLRSRMFSYIVKYNFGDSANCRSSLTVKYSKRNKMEIHAA